MLPEQTGAPSYLTRIRGVPLLPQEWVNHSFTPTDGISPEPSATGRLLVTTNQRIISFSQGQKGDETVLVPVEELNGVVVRPESRSSGSLLQGLMLLVAGALIYLVSGYWLADRLEGPNIPIINLDVWALVILAALIWGGWLIGRHYFAKELGQVTFQGGNWAFSFPYTGDKPTAEVHQVIRAAFVSRTALVSRNHQQGHGPEQPL
ncbi:MAG: hypothetical protein IH870_00905 [Chloroflexi bacterium]|nr:hypothetical protein [Chloroflexota bacterium]